MNNIHYTRIGDLGMKLQFLNGSITIPNKPGAYVVAPGCGSGKTTAIRQIIRENFSTGILYSAATIEECNDMYQYCKGLVDEFNDPDILKLDDIIVLHSDYRSDDSVVMRSKVVLCTHELLTDPYTLTATREFNEEVYDPIEKLSSYSRALRNSYASDGVMTINKPRSFIIFDEIPSSVNLDNWISDDMDECHLLIFSSTAYILTETKQTRLLCYKYSHPEEVKNFLGLDIDFPSKLKFKDGRRYDLEKKFTNKSLGSRGSRLSNRSVQEQLFDLLIRTKFIKDRVVEEVILPWNDSYIIVDYYFPDNRLIVELDSSYHDELKDSKRDRFLSSLGLRVERFYEFRGKDHELDQLSELLNSTRGQGELHLDLFCSPDIDYNDLRTFYQNSNKSLDKYLWREYDFTYSDSPRYLLLMSHPSGYKSNVGLIRLREKNYE